MTTICHWMNPPIIIFRVCQWIQQYWLCTVTANTAMKNTLGIIMKALLKIWPQNFLMFLNQIFKKTACTNATDCKTYCESSSLHTSNQDKVLWWCCYRQGCEKKHNNTKYLMKNSSYSEKLNIYKMAKSVFWWAAHFKKTIRFEIGQGMANLATLMQSVLLCLQNEVWNHFLAAEFSVFYAPPCS